MSERQDFAPNQTDRPARTADALLTVSDVLAMPALRVGAPEVLVGGEALTAEVRWVHASDSADVARLLDGGELLLTTAAGWPGAVDDLGAMVGDLVDAGVAGIVLELGPRHSHVPEPVRAACAAAGLALIALTSEVKFVAVTEAVHRALIAAQTDALHQRQRLHELFTALSLRGVPADVIVAETARAIGAPVVLSNHAHEVIAVEGVRMPVAAALAAWSAGDDPSIDRVPVQARDVRWGTLTALPGPPHPAGRLTVLEQGATALAFGRLAEGSDAAWSLLAQRGVIGDLLGQRFATHDDIAARLRAGGFPVNGRPTMGLVARGSDAGGEIVTRARVEGAAAVAAHIDGDDVVLLSAPTESGLSDDVIARIAGARRVVFVGPVADGVQSLLASVRAARDLAATDSGEVGPLVRRVDARPLERLVASMRDDHRLQEHSARMLAPLIRHDRERRGDLLDVLAALVAHPGNRSAAAAASHLSRSVFYQRLTLIGDLVNADLDDGETLAALHLALLAHRRTASGAR